MAAVVEAMFACLQRNLLDTDFRISTVLSLASHAWPLALEHWQNSPCPFDRLRTFQARSRLAEVVAAGHGLLVLLYGSRDRKDFVVNSIYVFKTTAFV